MPNVDRESAITIARQRIAQIASEAQGQFEIMPEATMEIEQGWLFFYNSAEFLRTGNPGSQLAGNGPILVTHEGRIFELPSSVPWEDAIRKI